MVIRIAGHDTYYVKKWKHRYVVIILLLLDFNVCEEVLELKPVPVEKMLP